MEGTATREVLRRSSRRAKPNVGKDGEPVALPKTISRTRKEREEQPEIDNNAMASNVADVLQRQLLQRQQRWY